MERKEIGYLAIPYSHPNPHISRQRFEIANKVLAYYVRQGKAIFSPISHTHPVAKYCPEFEEWVEYDKAFMDVCDYLIVVCIEGWQQSDGVKREIEYFRDQGKSVQYMHPNDFPERLEV